MEGVERVGAEAGEPGRRTRLIVPCVNFCDYLSETLPLSRTQVDDVFVSTHDSDVETLSYCAAHHVAAVVTPAPAGGAFRKGAVLNAALDQSADWDGWIVLADADVCLPPGFAEAVRGLPVAGNRIYGAGQRFCYSFREWREYRATRRADPAWPRVAREHRRAHVAMGALQVFRAEWLRAPHCRRYPEFTVDARGKGSDFYFRNGFRRKLAIAGVEVIHVSAVPLGANWDRRTSARFGPG